MNMNVGINCNPHSSKQSIQERVIMIYKPGLLENSCSWHIVSINQ